MLRFIQRAGSLMPQAHPMVTTVVTIAVLAVGIFIALSALLYLRQESFIFFPRANDPLLKMKHQAQRVQIRTPGATLEGWLIDNPRATTPLTLLYFGGNAEDVLYTASTAPLFDAQRLLVVNYRGYGGSSGKPGQAALYEDALAIHRYAVTLPGVSPEQLVVMGRSLGAALAAMLAAQRPLAGVVLITPFDSLTAVAARHYPMFPVRWLLRHRFPSIEWARQAQAPALIVAAQGDTIIPPVHAEDLHQAWAAEKELRVLDGVGHNDIELHEEYYASINAFLRGLASAAAPTPAP